MKVNQLKELIRQVVKEEEDYQQLFKTMLDKSGKSIPSMSDDEKKTFFNAVDTAYKAKSEGRLRGYNEAELSGGQKKIDVDGDGEIEGSDLAALRAKKDETLKEYDEWKNTRIQAKNIFRMLKQKYNNNISKMQDGLEDIFKQNKTKNDQAEVMRDEFNKYFKIKEVVEKKK
jgi:hypothetical protein